MTADALSQDEIDALLKGAGGEGVEPEPASADSALSLSPDQVEALRKYGEVTGPVLTEMIGTFMGRTITVRAEEPKGEAAAGLSETLGGPVVVCAFDYESGLSGRTALVFRREDACRIGGTMLGEPDLADYSETVAGAFQEVAGTLVGKLDAALGETLGRPVATSDFKPEAIENTAEALSEALSGEVGFALIPYRLSLAEGVETDCWQMVSTALLGELDSLAAPAPVAEPSPPEPEAMTGQAAPVEFETLTQDEPSAPTPANLDLIMDIGLEIRVELGRTHMKIRDVLNLGGGSVVELDKLAGEPVDLLVNDVIFAKGEVVVIDEYFGVRITDILTLDDRIKTLGELKE